jgi:hypothetical protein
MTTVTRTIVIKVITDRCLFGALLIVNDRLRSELLLSDSRRQLSLFIGIRVLLRGKAHAQMKITKSGERRTVKDDQYLLDEKAVIFGKGIL